MSQEKENANENEAPRIPGAFRPGDPVPIQPMLPTAGKTVDDEPDYDKAGTHVDPMKSSDLGNEHHRGKPAEGGHHKAGR